MTSATIGKIVLTCAVVLGGAGFLVYSAFGSTEKYRMVHDLVHDGFDKWKDTDLKVHGYVQAGSIIEAIEGQDTDRTFILERNGVRIRVFSKGPKPDTFKDRAEVIATGRLVPGADLQARADAICKALKNPTGCPIRADAEQKMVLDSTDMTAKCPSKYDGAPAIELNPQYK
ncbi:MAG TPA: cytochrome c maturation protein CcmE [Kofleriaceae bacterium]|nr:cytochrome c maturation protein CcmE [Kofleriaceae bacterium]